MLIYLNLLGYFLSKFSIITVKAVTGNRNGADKESEIFKVIITAIYSYL